MNFKFDCLLSVFHCFEIRPSLILLSGFHVIYLSAVLAELYFFISPFLFLMQQVKCPDIFCILLNGCAVLHCLFSGIIKFLISYFIWKTGKWMEEAKKRLCWKLSSHLKEAGGYWTIKRFFACLPDLRQENYERLIQSFKGSYKALKWLKV